MRLWLDNIIVLFYTINCFLRGGLFNIIYPHELWIRTMLEFLTKISGNRRAITYI